MCYLSVHFELRADTRFALSQWEKALLCNNVSHWLGANQESALELTATYLLIWTVIE